MPKTPGEYAHIPHTRTHTGFGQQQTHVTDAYTWMYDTSAEVLSAIAGGISFISSDNRSNCGSGALVICARAHINKFYASTEQTLSE